MLRMNLRPIPLLFTLGLACACTKAGEPAKQEPDMNAAREAAMISRGLPSKMVPYLPEIQRSRMRAIVALPHKRTGTAPWVSKFRGLPYMPTSMEYPRDPDGNNLAMLVQINFEEMPPLEGYPTTGILQFFVSGSQERGFALGMPTRRPQSQPANFDALRESKYFRLIYHPTIVKDRTALLRETPATPAWRLPITEEASLSFEQHLSYVRTGDYRFARFFGKDFYDFYRTTLSEDVSAVNDYWQLSEGRFLLQLGGYSRTELGYDPRIERRNEDWLVLLSIDSYGPAQGDFTIAWGDGGVANLWIRREDLARRDFSNVAYYWDGG
jgi:uncharacterized protein YwqG